MDNRKIQVLEGDMGGDSIYINLDCGRQLSFCVDFVPEANRQWLGEVLQRQVNEIVHRERHNAVEDYKSELNNLLRPKPLCAYDHNKEG